MAGPVTSAAVALVVLALAEHERRRGIVGRVVNSAAGVVDVEALVEEIDLDRVLSDVDIDALVQRIDIDALVKRIDIDDVVSRIDIDTLVKRIDIDDVVSRIDIDEVVKRIDIDEVVKRIDIEDVVSRIDMNALVDRIDPDRLLDRVDVDRLVDRMDIKAVVDEAGIADIVAESTGALTGSFVDVVRRQVVALDTIADGFVFRLTRRDPQTRPKAPKLLAPFVGQVEDGRRQITGQYAGPVSRVFAFVMDFWLVIGSYAVISAGVAWLTSLSGTTINIDQNASIAGVILLITYAFLYWYLGLSLTGKTVGKAVLGLSIVSREGAPLRGRQALIRTLAEPLSFLLLGIGNFIALLSPTRATLHDRIAKTSEIYDWGDRPAELPAPITAWVMQRDPEDMNELKPAPRMR